MRGEGSINSGRLAEADRGRGGLPDHALQPPDHPHGEADELGLRGVGDVAGEEDEAPGIGVPQEGALIGAQKGLDVYVLDRPTDGLKPELVRDLGATYVTGDVVEQMQQIAPDVVIEATGAVPVISGVLANNVPYGIVCLTGISAPKEQEVDLGHINRDLVLDNGVVVGSVNANLRHYQGAAEVLAKADNAWLERLITRRVPLEKFAEAFERRDGDVKVVIDLV